MRNGLIEKTFVWELRSPPDKLWPILSDTARLNEALDLPLYRLGETFDSDDRRRRYGELDEDGVRIRWEEPPFEWVEGYWWRWRRFYESGPLLETGGTLILNPGDTGGTRASYALSVEPKGALGRLLVASGHLKIAAQNIEKIIIRADAHCQKPVGDFFSNLFAETSPKAKSPDIPCVTEDPRDASLLAQLGAWIAVAPQADVVDLRSRRLSRALGISEGEALRACLLGVAGGALRRRYRSICPACRVGAMEYADLADIPALMACQHCGAGYRRDLLGNTEILFAVSPELRAHPGGSYCSSGASTQPHVVIRQNIDAMERRGIDFSARPGLHAVRVMDGLVSEPFEMGEGVVIAVTDDALSVSHSDQGLVLENRLSQPATLSIERCEWPDDCLPVSDLIADPGFRELETAQKLSEGDSAAAGAAAIMAVSPLDGLVQRHVDMAASLGGAVCGYDDMSVLLVFLDGAGAIEFANELSALLPQTRIGIDYGPLTAATEGGMFSYIGTVPDTALEMCLSAPPGKVSRSARLSEMQTAPGLVAGAAR